MNNNYIISIDDEYKGIKKLKEAEMDYDTLKIKANNKIKFSVLERFCQIEGENLLIHQIQFLKLSYEEILKKAKKCKKIYNFTEHNDKGLVVGLLEVKDNINNLIIASTSIIKLPTNSSCLFSAYNRCFNLTNLEKISFDNIDTSEVENMSSIFCGLEKIKELNIESFNTINVTDMSEMFGNCYKLKYINLKSIKTNNVKDYSEMFLDCESLKELDLSNMYTSNGESFMWMFCGCKSLEKLIINNFNIENSTTIYGMLDCCFNLNYIDMSNIKEETIIEKEKDDFLLRSIKISACIKLKNENINI